MTIDQLRQAVSDRKGKSHIVVKSALLYEMLDRCAENAKLRERVAELERAVARLKVAAS